MVGGRADRGEVKTDIVDLLSLPSPGNLGGHVSWSLLEGLRAQKRGYEG